MSATLEFVNVAAGGSCPSNLPLIFVPDGGGSIYQYFMLGTMHREVYAIASPYFDSGRRPEAGIPQLAAEYIQAIRDGTQHKSFIIAGWCFGGVVALEIARQLHHDHALEVAGVLMMDTDCPWYKGQQQLPESAPEFAVTTSDATKAKVERSLKNTEYMLATWTQPPAFEAPLVVLLRACTSLPSSTDLADEAAVATLGWSHAPFVRFKKIVDVPGSHYDMFSEDNLDVLTTTVDTSCGWFDLDFQGSSTNRINKADGVSAKAEEDKAGNPRLRLTFAELVDWLMVELEEKLHIRLASPDDDIFSAGVDSLQTIRIWRLLQKKLDLGQTGHQLSQNIVFEKGTVRQLARHLYRLRIGEEANTDEEADEQDESAVMQSMIDRYSNFTTHCPSHRARHPRQEVVLVTGATGNLGAFIVDELIKRPDVSEIWTLVRAPHPAAATERVAQSLSVRGITLTDRARCKLRAIPSDLGEPNLGLNEQDLQHLLENLTCVIHSAWAVNFNLSVSSFEQQHIRGTTNLINLCLRSQLAEPARFYFCSSISTAGNTPKPASIQERSIDELKHAHGTGYGCSKLVAEHIARNAMLQTGMLARTLRIGQLSGDTVTNYWNETEAIALMVRSVLTTGALPDLSVDRVSWLPVDYCARAIVDLCFRQDQRAADTELVYHLVNPKTFSFRNDLLPALKRSSLPSFEVVSPDEWLGRLANSELDVELNPSIKLLDFWRAQYGRTTPSPDVATTAVVDDAAIDTALTFETTRTACDCPFLGTIVDPVSEGLVEKYINVWMKRWSRLE